MVSPLGDVVSPLRDVVLSLGDGVSPLCDVISLLCDVVSSYVIQFRHNFISSLRVVVCSLCDTVLS